MKLFEITYEFYIAIAIGVSTWHSSGIALLRRPVVVTEGHDVTNLNQGHAHGALGLAMSSNWTLWLIPLDDSRCICERMIMTQTVRAVRSSPGRSGTHASILNSVFVMRSFAVT